MTNFVIARSRPDEKWRIPVVIDQWFESYRQNKIYIKPIPLGHGWFENFNFNFNILLFVIRTINNIIDEWGFTTRYSYGIKCSG